MQPNVITLPTDVLNNGTPVAQPYTRFEEAANRTIYVSAGHLPNSRDMLALYRSSPTRSGNFLGTTKSSFKFTEDVIVKDAMGNDTVQPVLFEVSTSVPVGALPAKTKELRQRAIALLDNDGIMYDLNDRGMI